jgi:Subtilase family
MLKRNLVCSLMANERVLPPVLITLSSELPFDLVQAKKALKVTRQKLLINLSKDGYTLEIRAQGDFRPGLHHLNIGQLQSIKGKPLNQPYTLPFMVIASKLTLPQDVQIEHWVRLQIDEYMTQPLPLETLPEGPFVDIIKVNEKESNEPIDLAFDESDNPVDAVALLRDLNQRRATHFGRLDETLYRYIEKAPTTETISVAIWLKVPNLNYPDKTLEGSPLEAPPEEQKLSEIIGGVTASFQYKLQKEFEVTEVATDPLAPVVYATLTAEQILKISQLTEVAYFLNETQGVNDLTQSMKLSEADLVQQLPTPLTGLGVKVAVWESGPKDISGLILEAQFTSAPASSPTKEKHSRLTHAIIKNNNSGSNPKGYAPGCKLYSANSHQREALVWAVQKGCTVISQSFHRVSEPASSGLSFEDIYLDYLSTRFPYPTIVQAAGNLGDNEANPEYVNHKGYNSLKVGNQASKKSMASTSASLNPVTLHQDRELPEIAAVGVNVSVVALGLFAQSGTSFSAPAVAGCAALIQEADSTLQGWPEGCRAILLAGAKRIESNTWWNNLSAHLDVKSGSGALNAREAVTIAQSRQLASSGAGSPGSARGWDVRNLKAEDFAINKLSSFSYRIKVPVTLQFPKVKAVIAWNSWWQGGTDFSMPPASLLHLDDLDLLVFSGGQQVANSSSWDNSYEIVEFEAQPNQTYDLRIRLRTGLGQNRLGIAWSVFE